MPLSSRVILSGGGPKQPEIAGFGAENPRITMTFLAPARLAVHSHLSGHARLS
jgi:hypothetical protein